MWTKEDDNGYYNGTNEKKVQVRKLIFKTRHCSALCRMELRRVTLSNSALAAALCCGCLSEAPFIKWWLSVQKVRKTFQFKHNKIFKWELYISFGESIHLDYYYGRLLILIIMLLEFMKLKMLNIFFFGKLSRSCSRYKIHLFMFGWSATGEWTKNWLGNWKLICLIVKWKQI